MNLTPVEAGRLHHPDVREYFTRNPHRMAACRALLDLLGISLPDWAERDISGRAAARRNTMAAFRVDHPETLAEATARKAGMIDTSFLTN